MKFKQIVLNVGLTFALFLSLGGTSFAAKPVSDDFLIDTIRQKLAADQVVKGGAIDVAVKNGAVVLKGRVEEERQKNKAEKIAKKVSGVKSVENDIQIAHP
jgi:osmotically-inducible protein OsmY